MLIALSKQAGARASFLPRPGGLASYQVSPASPSSSAARRRACRRTSICLPRHLDREPHLDADPVRPCGLDQALSTAFSFCVPASFLELETARQGRRGRPEMGARNLIFCRTLVLGSGRHVHACSPKHASGRYLSQAASSVSNILRVRSQINAITDIHRGLLVIRGPVKSTL